MQHFDFTTSLRVDSIMEPDSRNSLLSSSASSTTPLATQSGPQISDDNRRVFARRRVVWKASIQCSHHNFDCHVHDISMSGARLKLDVPLASNYGVVLSIPGISPLAAKTIWYSNGLLGIEFIAKLSFIESQLGKRITSSQLSDWK